MPSLQDREDKLEYVIVVCADQRAFQVTRHDVIRDSDWGKVKFQDPNTSRANIEVISPIAGMFFHWLDKSFIVPYTDLSVATENASGSYIAPDCTGTVTVDSLNDTSCERDREPNNIGFSRRLFHAYFFGQDIGAPHFQDAVMNAIIKNLAITGPIPVSLVNEVYMRVAQQPNSGIGLKRFLIDYFVWSTTPETRLGRRVPRVAHVLGLNPQSVPNLDGYHYLFQQDVKITMVAGHDGVDMMRVWSSLMDPSGPAGRCRYHHHSENGLCFNLIVNDSRK